MLDEYSLAYIGNIFGRGYRRNVNRYEFIFFSQNIHGRERIIRLKTRRGRKIDAKKHLSD